MTQFKISLDLVIGASEEYRAGNYMASLAIIKEAGNIIKEAGNIIKEAGNIIKEAGNILSEKKT